MPASSSTQTAPSSSKRLYRQRLPPATASDSTPAPTRASSLQRRLQGFSKINMQPRRSATSSNNQAHPQGRPVLLHQVAAARSARSPGKPTELPEKGGEVHCIKKGPLPPEYFRVQA
ncbi:Protein of unknown function [Gryllus bimaculatus]|nr:Protein of unknown function [Gryllus bimaculatus]